MGPTVELVQPSPQSPVKPSGDFILPLPQDYQFLLNAEANASASRAAVAPTLRWQISPALDSIAATGSKRCVQDLHRRLCTPLQPDVTKEQNVIAVFKDICRVELGPQNAEMMVTGYQLDADDPSTAEQLILDIKGGLSPLRLELVRDVYNFISKSAVQPQNFTKTAKTLFNPLGHPRVQSGEIGADRLHNQFCSQWDNAADDGSVELIEWEFYYASLGSSIDGDDFFEKMILGCWPGLLSSQNTAGMDLKNRKSTYMSGLQLGQADYRAKKKLATNFRKLDALLLEPQTFRTAMDLCIMRNPPPPSPPAQQPLFSRPYLRALIAELYDLVGCRLNPGSDEEEQMFESIYRRVIKEAGPGQKGIQELEWTLRSALRRECNFLEYKIVARTADLG
ncbi:hypothetical protein HDU87_008544 [Geranomyces variabilis]|uniref:Uncharacterized protein n=1 Tax=Geranomyces variabilis TaxID=109894 RepID=A0AAD5TNV9_9FUNG|nr:hypothetical protein HDU87_008544 [Geranomyces variabilis]